MPRRQSRLIGKDPDARKDWRQKEKRVAEDEIDSITNSVNSTDMNLSKLPADSEGQGSLACCSPWGHKESDTMEWLNTKKRRQRGCGASTSLCHVCSSTTCLDRLRIEAEGRVLDWEAGKSLGYFLCPQPPGGPLSEEGHWLSGLCFLPLLGGYPL